MKLEALNPKDPSPFIPLRKSYPCCKEENEIDEKEEHSSFLLKDSIETDVWLSEESVARNNAIFPCT